MTLIIVLISVTFLQIFKCIWNEFNLEARRKHRKLVAFYLDTYQLEKAEYHIEKWQNLSKWYIRV